MHVRCFVLAVSIAGLFPANSAADPTKVDSSRIDEIFTAWDKPTSPGLAISVVHNGEVIYKRGYGSANLEHRLPITTTTAFNIGSTSKQFTAFAILLLAKDGKLSLDDSVRKHIPEVPDFGKPLTVRHLLHHTSGLREDWSLLAMSGTRSEDVIRTPDLLRLIGKQQELNFAPGAEYLYCNTGYDLLAEIVRRVSGKSLREFAHDRIFAPAGMKTSEFCDDYRMLIANRATCYRPRGTGFEHVHFATERAGPSNLFTTAEDLARWAIYAESLTKSDAALATEVLRRGKLTDGKELNYAAGLQHAVYRNAKVIQHSGSTAGYRATLHRYPEHQFAIAILSNLATAAPDDLAHRVADIYLADKLGPRPETLKPKQPEVEEKYTPAADELATCTGKYYSEELEVLYTVRLLNGALVVTHPKGDLALRPVRKDTFEARGIDLIFDKLEVTRDAKGAVTGFKISTTRARNIRFAKVELKPVG